MENCSPSKMSRRLSGWILLLNRPPPTEEAKTQAELELDVITALQTRQVIITAFKCLKNGIAPGSDNLNSKLVEFLAFSDAFETISCDW